MKAAMVTAAAVGVVEGTFAGWGWLQTMLGRSTAGSSLGWAVVVAVAVARKRPLKVVSVAASSVAMGEVAVVGQHSSADVHPPALVWRAHYGKAAVPHRLMVAEVVALSSVAVLE
jgi:hypothetical protein